MLPELIGRLRNPVATPSRRGPLPNDDASDPLRARQPGRDRAGRRTAQLAGCERSVKIKLKIKKTYFENKSNTILKIKNLAAKTK